MYVVVSRWEVQPEDRDAFAERALLVRETARALPGAVQVEGFYGEDGTAVILMFFETEEAYAGIYADIDSPFARALDAQRLDTLGRWLGSDRGELLP